MGDAPVGYKEFGLPGLAAARLRHHEQIGFAQSKKKTLGVQCFEPRPFIRSESGM